MSATPSISVVHVVVPARNEESALPGLLASLRSAVQEVRRVRPHLVVQATVVLDSCTDASEVVVATHPWVGILRIRCGVVGEVRARGVERARRLATGVDPARVWIACTDADTVVPATWVLEQVRLAEEGHAVVVGTVLPDPAGTTPEVLAAWRRRHRLEEGHPHVHGANLGFSLAAYDVVGGFAALRTGEDVDLVARMRSADLPCHATARTQVLTSARRHGRAPDGFAAYLRDLDPDGVPRRAPA